MVAVFERLFARYVCECGTVYRVTTTVSLVPTADIVVCEHCGNVLDSWRDSRRPRAYYVERQSNW